MLIEPLSQMDPELQKTVVTSMGKLGGAAALAFAAIGSALGTGAAGSAAAGAMKKSYAQNKTPPFMVIAFVGFPLTQTIYGMIVQGMIVGAATADAMFHNLFLGGLLAGIAMGMSAWMQGRAAAGACNALAETGKGIANYVIVLGMIETVALFVMAFAKNAIT
ncbi:MAG: V-type ATP synthase subunit K [Kiritimatiellia bacterium]